jgi:hypothetical protein
VLLGAALAGLPVAEYTPAEVKQAIAGYRQRRQSPGAADGDAPAAPGPAPSPDAMLPTGWRIAICHLQVIQYNRLL